MQVSLRTLLEVTRVGKKHRLIMKPSSDLRIERIVSCGRKNAFLARIYFNPTSVGKLPV